MGKCEEKYEEITERFQARYPKVDSGVSEEAFPNCNDPTAFTTERVTPKVKRLKANFRKAIDSGRRSGGGRVVLALYDECLEVWSGSPAVESISLGVKSSNLLEEADSKNADSLPLDSCTEDSLSSTNNDTSEDTETEDLPKRPAIKDMAEIRRNLVKNLKERRTANLLKGCQLMHNC